MKRALFDANILLDVMLERPIDTIITRNKRDFKGFPIKAVFPEEILS